MAFAIPPTLITEEIKPGLGDYTEHLLSSIGVTKERYTAAKELFGLPPDCGCAKRQAALNEWSRRVSDWWRGTAPPPTP